MVMTDFAHIAVAVVVASVVSVSAAALVIAVVADALVVVVGVTLVTFEVEHDRIFLSHWIRLSHGLKSCLLCTFPWFVHFMLVCHPRRNVLFDFTASTSVFASLVHS